MRYLPDHNITFIHNPKTAGTSISTWLDDNFKTIKGRKHGHHLEVKEFFPNTIFTFGVVRNPWARMVSWYKFANIGNESFQEWMINRFQKGGMGLSFRPGLSWAGIWYSLATPQADWFGDDTNLILRFENLQQDFEQVKNLLHCNKELCILNTNEPYDYRTYYNNELIELVRDVFIKDVIRYNYDYEV